MQVLMLLVPMLGSPLQGLQWSTAWETAWDRAAHADRALAAFPPVERENTVFACMVLPGWVLPSADLPGMVLPGLELPGTELPGMALGGRVLGIAQGMAQVPRTLEPTVLVGIMWMWMVELVAATARNPFSNDYPI